jgi:hypothetical protein
MPAGRERVLSDDALDRLARELFAEVRAQHPQKPLGRPADDAASDVGTDLLEWLLDAGDDTGDGDSEDWGTFEPVAMFTTDVAELTGKRHDHVMRDARKMLVELHGEGAPQFWDTDRNEQNGQEYPCYRCPSASWRCS